MADNGTALVTEASGLRDRAALVQIGGNGLAPRNLAELMDFGQLMAKAGPMVGKAFRGNPGACVAITMRSMNWCMDPFAVSQKAYVTVDKFGNEQIGYEAQLVAAVIHSRAPIKNRPDYEYAGQGANRTCTVSATFKRETKPKTYTTPPLSQIASKSPLWQIDQDQQLGYYAIRAWSRRHCPELIMGVYTPDELETIEPINVSPVSVENYDQRTDEERVGEARSSYAAKQDGDGVWADAVLAACQTEAELDDLLMSSRWKKLPKGWRETFRDKIEIVRERVKSGGDADLSPFDGLKQAGLECLQVEAPEARQEAFEIWAGSLTPEKLEACADDQRTELRTLYKRIKAEIAG